MPDGAPSQETLDTLVRALQAHRDTLVQASLHLKDLFANMQSDQRQAVTEQLERYLEDMARGAQPTQGGEGPNRSSSGSSPCP